MATPAFVNFGAQWGPETTPGSAVAAGVDFRAETVTISPVVETAKHRPSGSRFATTVYPTREYSEGTIEAVPSWSSIGDFLYWSLGTGSTTANADNTDTTVYEVGAGHTRTIEYGDRSTGIGSRIAGAAVTSFGMTWGRNSGDATLTANITGGVFEDAITLSTITDSADVEPIIAASVSVYLDSSLANIGTTKLDGALSVSMETGDIRQPTWVLDAAQESYNGWVDNPMEDAKVTLKVMADSVGRALLDTLRNSEKRYLRIEVTGAPVGTDVAVQTLTIDLCVMPEDHSREEDNAVYAVTSSLVVTEDASGFSAAFTLIDETVA